jgi:radical SAM superfamily enzyme YgiQ (UPF0313 family)
MRVLLISVNKEEINMKAWPLGAGCVATAALHAGHEVILLDLMSETAPESVATDVIRNFRPEVIGVSIRNVDDQRMDDPKFFLNDVQELISRCRSLTNSPIVLGGAGYSIYPVSLLEYLAADMGIQGEGEIAFLLLLERLEKNEDLSGVPGLLLSTGEALGSRRLEKNLDGLSLPDSRFLPKYASGDDQFWLPVQTRRGCPMKCSYCSTASIEGCTLRERSPEAVVRWIDACVGKGFRRYYFVDNTFNLPPSYAKKLCSKLAAAGLEIAWRCIIYPLHVDEELAQLMAAAGCEDVSVGFESGSEPMLHNMNKRFSPDQVREVCEILGRHGICRMGFLMLGGPGETKASALESLNFADSLDLDMMKITVGIRIYPYTALAETAREEGLIAKDDNLLTPRFYIASGLGGWLRETVDHWISTRPNWVK